MGGSEDDDDDDGAPPCGGRRQWQCQLVYWMDIILPDGFTSVTVRIWTLQSVSPECLDFLSRIKICETEKEGFFLETELTSIFWVKEFGAYMWIFFCSRLFIWAEEINYVRSKQRNMSLLHASTEICSSIMLLSIIVSRTISRRGGENNGKQAKNRHLLMWTVEYWIGTSRAAGFNSKTPGAVCASEQLHIYLYI